MPRQRAYCLALLARQRRAFFSTSVAQVICNAGQTWIYLRAEIGFVSLATAIFTCAKSIDFASA